MSVNLTLKNLYDEIQSILGYGWMSRNSIEKETVLTSIEDEFSLIAGDMGILEGEFTGVGDGTNPYLEVNEILAVVRRVHYGYTAGSDWGDILEEITPLQETGEIGSGDPSGYWVQSMHRNNRQRIYFDKIPATTATIRILFYKWADDYIEADTIEFKRLFANIAKHGVAANFLSRDKRRTGEYNHALMQKAEAKAASNKMRNLQGTGLNVNFTDV